LQNITDMQRIYEPYRIIKTCVKSKARKCGFEKIKRGNPLTQIHHQKFRLQTDIQNGSWENFIQIMAAFDGCVAFLKKGYHNKMQASKSWC
jgi:hypothetical protein